MLQPKEGMRICDPTVGSGGMLHESAAYVEHHGGNLRNLTLHGEDRNLGTWAICRYPRQPALPNGRFSTC